MRHLIAPNVLLLVAYVITGWGALQVAVSPGYVAPLFPPAGLALAAVLIRGPGLLLGAFLGSLGVQLLASVQSGLAPGLSPALFLVPAGLTLATAFGRWLTGRLIGLPLQLDRPRDILCFNALVAPVSCALGASLAVPVLVAGQVFPANEFGFVWINWWIGDTLGVLIMLPLVMVFFGEPAEAWRSRRQAVAMPMLIALALLGLLFSQVQRWDEVRLRSDFDRDVDTVSNLMRHRLAAQLDQVLSLERLATVHGAMDRAAWAEFVKPFLTRYPGTQNFGWSPWVSEADRRSFEARVRAEAFPDFSILGRNPQGETYPAEAAREYLPITFVEPLAGNQRVVGLDPLVLPQTREAVQQTRASRQPVATQSIRLVQETGEQRGVVVYQAVFDARNGQPRGLISSVFRMDDTLDATLPPLLRQQLQLCLTETVRDGLQRLYGAPGCEQVGWQAKGLRRQILIPFAGQTWSLVAVATPGYLHDQANWSGWVTLLVGLISTGVIGAFLLLTSGRARLIEVLVDARTHQLAEATRQLEMKQEDLVQAQRLARIGSWEQSALGDLVCSEELVRMLGLPAGEALRVEDLILAVVPEHRAPLREALSRVAEGDDAVDLDGRVQIGHEPVRTLNFRLASFPEEGGARTIHGIAQDVTAARVAEAHIAYLARYDRLTGLPNRSYWQERVEAELAAGVRHGDRHAVLFLDLDHFKAVNDSLGHPVGDRLLTEAARRLTECVRDSDLIGRLGGDEFVILLPRLVHQEDAAVVARKLIAALAQPMIIDTHELTVSASIGIALYPEDGEDVSTLLKHADAAMYSAKAQGRNAFHFFENEMDARALERLMLENALRRAIERDELILHFQPQVSADRGTVVGCEALVRWEHPERGLLGPNEFIGVAEDSGLIGALGEWVLRAACRQQVQWASAGWVLEMAVNISPWQFRKADFAERVLAIVAETGIDPAALELELTESALMEPSPEVVGRMQRLRDQGIGLALDDFGTGYSNLTNLKRLPIARLKIDRSFVRDLPDDPEDVAIAGATLSLARDLGMRVVAEGVENEAQRAYLLERGCTLMQGFLFSRPVDAAGFLVWLTRHVTRLPA